MPKNDEFERHKLLTFQIYFKGSLKEEHEIRQAIENFIFSLKLNTMNYKARILNKHEIENLNC